MAQQLAGKIAWITGAGTGIGEASAIALAREGAITILTGRRPENLENTAAQIRSFGGEAHVRPADLMKAAEVQQIGVFIAEKFGRLDILVNNAGVNITDRHWDRLTPSGIDVLVCERLGPAPALLAYRFKLADAGIFWRIGAFSARRVVRSSPRGFRRA